MGAAGDAAADGTRGAPVVSARGLRKSFGPTDVLRGLDLDVGAGEVVALLGPSGSGKSTFLRCVNGLEPFDDGALEVLGHALAPGPPSRADERALRALRARVGFVFQAFHLYPHRTALGNVALAPEIVRGLPRERAEALARERLADVGLESKAHAFPRSLSGGERQRVAIARALAMEPDLLLFDEPTSALDPENTGEVLDSIRALASERRRAIVIVTHEVAFAEEAADRVAFLDAGRVVEEGPPRSVLRAPAHERTRRFLERVRRAPDGGSEGP
jgi:ABC-type polar amino acid transport system ATPase subunit